MFSCCSIDTVVEEKKVDFDTNETIQQKQLSDLDLKHMKLYRITECTRIARVAKIVDGDTIHAVFFPPECKIAQRHSIRLFGIDTPELRSKITKEKALAQEAKEFVCKLIPPGTFIKIQFHGSDKYGRLLGQIFYKEQGTETFKEQTLNQLLIEKKLAQRYDGGKKPDFTLS